MKGKQNKILIFVFSFIIVFGVGFFGSFFTSNTVNSNWYLESKPDFTPPSWVFGPVWTLLYVLIALSLYFVWIKAKKIERKKIAAAFGMNLVANGLWSYLFFGLQNPLFAFVDILFILGTIIWMIFVTAQIDKKAAWLLVPYLLWVGFASVLNFRFII